MTKEEIEAAAHRMVERVNAMGQEAAEVYATGAIAGLREAMLASGVPASVIDELRLLLGATFHAGWNDGYFAAVQPGAADKRVAAAEANAQRCLDQAEGYCARWVTLQGWASEYIARALASNLSPEHMAKVRAFADQIEVQRQVTP